MIEILQQRLNSYGVTTPVAEAQAVREILQEVVLYALWRVKFFEVAAFQGGTSLRILHGMNRFSEDLDFILKNPDAGFDWARYLAGLESGLREFGIQPEVLDRSRMNRNLRAALVKDDSVGQQLNLGFRGDHRRQTVRIKLEVDVHPPAGSGFDYSYLDFPLDFEVCHQDLASNFSLKLHALLCRPYVKGRDWFDFNWYVKQAVSPNYLHLRAALNQHGPWRGCDLAIDRTWLVEQLSEKVGSIDWQAAADDVRRFLGPAEQQSLALWSERFFRQKVRRL